MDRTWMAWILVPVLAAVLSWSQDRNYKKSAEKVKISMDAGTRAQSQKDERWKQIVEWLENKDNWEKMFKAIDDHLGVYRPEGIPITVKIQTTKFQNKWTGARGRATQGGGEMEISLPAIADFTSSRVGKGYKTDLLQVTDMFVTHELTHCLQQTSSGEKLIDQWPLWIIEGMGCFASEIDMYNEDLGMLRKAGVQDLDVVKWPEAYPRGRIFFKFLHEKYGTGKLKEFVGMIYKKTAHKHAIEKVTQKKWDEFKREELDWAKNFVKEKGM